MGTRKGPSTEEASLALALASESGMPPSMSTLQRALSEKRTRRKDETSIAMLLGAVRASGSVFPPSSSDCLRSLLRQRRSSGSHSVKAACDSTVPLFDEPCTGLSYDSDPSSRCDLDALTCSFPGEQPSDALHRARSLWDSYPSCACYCAHLLSEPLKHPHAHSLATRALAISLLAPKLASLPQRLQLNCSVLCASELCWLRMRYAGTASPLALEPLMPPMDSQAHHDPAASGIERSLQETSAGAKLVASLAICTVQHLERARIFSSSDRRSSSFAVDQDATVAFMVEVAQACRQYTLRVLDSIIVARIPIGKRPEQPLRPGPNQSSTAQVVWSITSGAFLESEGGTADNVITSLVRPFSSRTAEADPMLTDGIHRYQEWVPEVMQRERSSALAAAKCAEKPEALIHSRFDAKRGGGVPGWISGAVQAASNRRKEGLTAQDDCPTEAALMSEPSAEGRLAGAIAGELVMSRSEALAVEKEDNSVNEADRMEMKEYDWEIDHESVPWESARVFISAYGNVRDWSWGSGVPPTAAVRESASSGMLVHFRAQVNGISSEHTVTLHLSIAGDCEANVPVSAAVDQKDGTCGVRAIAHVGAPHLCGSLLGVASISIGSSKAKPVAQLEVPAGRFLLRLAGGLCVNGLFYLLWHSAQHALALSVVGNLSCDSLLPGMGHVVGSPVEGSESGLLCVAQGGILAAIVTMMELLPATGEGVYRLELRCSAEEPLEQARLSDVRAEELLQSISGGRLKSVLAEREAGEFVTVLGRDTEPEWMLESALECWHERIQDNRINSA